VIEKFWENARRAAVLLVIPGLPGRYQDGAELTFWLARGCSVVLAGRGVLLRGGFWP
jgi:hypothetical protein